jgi:hypothetical protein
MVDLYVDNLTDLDPDLVDQVQQELIQKLQEAFPEADIGRGVLHDVVLHLMSVLGAALETRYDRLRRAQSLWAIEQDPTLADDATVDAVLSNYRITRQLGAAATGQMTVVIDAAVPVTIPAGATYGAGGVAFAPERAYAARTSAATVTSDTDRVLRPLGDGTYAFTIPIRALAVGTRGALRRGARLEPEVRLPHFVAAYAEGDFSGGWDPESNADLVRRLQEGIATRAWSNRASIDALIRADDRFARILHTAIIGFGDPEMTRDRHTVFPIALGGRCDLYARTAQVPLSTTLTIACTFVRRTAAGTVWQFSLGRADLPGFYLIDRVAPIDAAPTDSGYALTSDIRGFDLTGMDWAPDIEDPVEAAYSAYQTGTFQFLDTDADTADLVENVTLRDYAVAVAHMPQIGDLQAFIGARAVRAPGGDVLVKAPVPCFTSISFVIGKRATVSAPPLEPIRAAVVELVNTLGFAGRLHASSIAGVVRDYLPAGAVLTGLDLFGRIRRPDGTWRPIRSPEALVVPAEPELLMTPRTVVFILDPADVAIDVIDLEAGDD